MEDKLGTTLYSYGCVYSKINVGDEELLYKAKLKKPKVRELTEAEQATSETKPAVTKDGESNSVQPATEGDSKAEPEYDEYFLKLKFIKAISKDDEEARAVVKMAIDDYFGSQKMLQLRRSYFSREAKSIQNGISVLQGFDVSVCPSDGGMSLLIDTSSRVLRD